MSMSRFRGYIYLIICSVLWGIAFVPQRSAMAHIGPFFFNALRFGFGGLILFLALGGSRLAIFSKRTMQCSVLLGALLFLGAAFQQVGLVYTSAGKGGFITSLYILFIPICLGIFWKERVSSFCWLGALIAVAGLALVSLQENLSLESGDTWVFVCALAFSLHVIAVGKIAADLDPVLVAIGQYLTCATLSFLVALLLEPIGTGVIISVWPQLVYMAVFSIGIAYTLQIFGQRLVPSQNASLIMALESVFAALGGWLMLGEVLNTRQLIGCGLMLVGTAIGQVPAKIKNSALPA